MQNKSLYLILGIICLLLVTPIISYLLTVNANSFEGANGFAFMYLLMILPFFLGFILLIDYLIFRDKPKYFKKRTRLFLVLIGISLTTYAVSAYIDSKERESWRRNRTPCKKNFEDGYTGFVVDTVRGLLRVRRNDSAYTDFRYYFSDRTMMKNYFYIGQELSKEANQSTFDVILRDGTTKTFTIPCYK